MAMEKEELIQLINVALSSSRKILVKTNGNWSCARMLRNIIWAKIVGCNPGDVAKLVSVRHLGYQSEESDRNVTISLPPKLDVNVLVDYFSRYLSVAEFAVAA